MNEAAFQAVVETVCFHTTRCIPELCLLVDPTKRYGDGRFGFIDLFFAPPKESSASSLPVLELKIVTLKGLWKATRTCPGDDLTVLRAALKAESEEDLLNRQFCYWDMEARDWHKQSIQNLKDMALQQVCKYLRVLTNGVSATPAGAGICDRRVQCGEGMDCLRDHVMICIGGTRVLSWLAAIEQTVYSFKSMYMI